MKAKKIAALCLASVLLLSGCGGKTVDGKSVVASTSEGNVYADDVYDTLISTSAGKSAAFQYVLDQLINKQYPVTSDMKDNASDMLDSIKNSYKSKYGEDSYEKQFKSDLKSAGYESESEYKKKLVYSLQYAELVKHYVKTHYDTVFDDYYKVSTPRVISMIKISTSDISNPTDAEKEKLEEVKELLKDGKNFGDVAKDYSDDSDTKSAKGSLGVVDKTSNLTSSYGNAINESAFSLTEGQTSDVLTGNDGYYILKCTSTNKEKIKKKLKNITIQSPLLTYDDNIIYLAFNTYDIEYKDAKVKKAVKEAVKEGLKARAEERNKR